MTKINFSPDALKDIKDIKKYISNELYNKQAAINTVDRIMKRVRQLADFPEMGAQLSSIINLEVPYRFLICGNYIIFYKVDDNEVHIIRVIYSKRNYMKLLFGRSKDEYL